MIRKLKYILPAVLLFTACKKQLDINTDPNNPAEVAVSKLLPRVEQSLGNSLVSGSTDTESGLTQILGTYMHQFSTRENPDQYGAVGSDFTLQTSWTTMYGSVLANADNIITSSTAAGNLKYAGIGKILKAYAFSQYVDVFGDVPYSEFNKLKEGILNPKFDKGADIYPSLMTLLNEAIADLNNTTATNVLVPGADDVIYGGKIANWVKAANTIKLKLLIQQRLVKDVSTEVKALLAAPAGLISKTDESFLLPYGVNGSTDDRNIGFSDYYASQRGQYISPWFYEILKGYNKYVNTGITDPRIPYYFFNQLKPTQKPESDQLVEYRDNGFVSIYFGSVGPDRDRTQQNNMTLVGMYPVGGRYDDGQGKDGVAGSKISASSATGAAPYRFITYADRLYLEAEAISVGIATGDAKAVFKSAVEESFKQVDYVISTYVKSSQTVPALVGTAAVTTYVDNVLAKYDAAPAGGSPPTTVTKLGYIMTQKWISSFGSSVDQYTDYRRTGYPILFNPKDENMAPGGFVQPPVAGNPVKNPQNKVEVQLNRNFPLTLPWYSTELETNSKAPAQKTDPSTYKPFWLP